jgi:hypothetical protein
VVVDSDDSSGLLAYRVAEDLSHPDLSLGEVVNWGPTVFRGNRGLRR